MVAAVTFVFEKENVIEFAHSVLEVDGVGGTLFDGTDVAFAKVGHAEAVFCYAESVEVTEQGRVEGVAVRGDGVEREGAAFAPFLAEFWFADVVVHIIAVFDKSVIEVSVWGAVEG